MKKWLQHATGLRKQYIKWEYKQRINIIKGGLQRINIIKGGLQQALFL